MTMPASGTISMSQINTELGRSSTAQISLDTAENGGYATINTNSSSRPSASNPASLSEWYSYNHSAAPANSVTISSTYYWSYTTLSSNSASGTITITGSSATFYARAIIINGTPTVTANINIGGNTRSAVRSKTTGTTDSSPLVLGPGTYSYTVSLSQAQNSGIAGGIVFTQP